METEATATEFQSLLEARGVTRRSFMKLCGAIAAAAGLSQLAAPKVAQAVEDSVIGAASGKLCPAIWIEGASCTGCTESFAQVDTPDPATVVLEMLSLNYSETLSAAAGYSMEEAKAQTIEKFKGEYILVYEGAVLEKWGGQALRVANEPGTKHLLEAAENAKYVVAFGSCAVNGGWMGATPNSSDALGVQQFLKKNNVATPVVNIPGCPGNPEHLVAVLVDVLMVGKVPELTDQGKPKQIFGQTIHDNCERRGHFENGEFVHEFGSEEEAKGYCLYALGCRGPQTYSNCGVTLWNHGRSWCVQAGSPCIGCCEADPNDPAQNWVQVNTPFYERHRDLRVGSIAFQPTTLFAGVTVLAAAALVVHGFGMKKFGRTDGGADFEKIRKWDAEHPDQSIGQYRDEVWEEVEAEKAAKAAAEEAAKAAAKPAAASVAGASAAGAVAGVADAVEEKPAEVAEVVEVADAVEAEAAETQAVAAEAVDAAVAAAVPAEKLFSKGFAHWLGADAIDDAEFEPFEEFVGSLLYKDVQPAEAVEAGPTAEMLFNKGFAHWIGADAAEDEKGGQE